MDGMNRYQSAAVTAVVVSYNVAPLLEPCLRSLTQAAVELGARGDRLEVVVVDNASADDSPGMVRRLFPDARLIENVRNLGFGAACNQGAAATEGGTRQGAGEAEAEGTERFTLFLNPDAVLGPGALAALLARLRATPRAAIAGPRVAYPDGRPQPTRRRFPRPIDLLLESTPLEWRGPARAPLRRWRMVGVPDGVAGPVDWLSGACLLVRREAFDAVGGFSPRFFMYFEEVDLARRLAALGWETWYEPAATVVHHHSRSADQNVAARDRHYYGSKYGYASRYYGAATARILRLTAGVLFAAESAIQTLRRDPPAARRYAALARWHFSPPPAGS
jgi:GT2 family glycosyltransferase